MSFNPGEIVDVTIKGASVARYDPDDPFTIHISPPGCAGAVELPNGVAYGVTVERVAPADWPPQPGDLWRDHDGDLWFAFDATDYDATVYDTNRPKFIRLCSTHAYRHGTNESPGNINSQYGPLALVHREDPDGTR